MAFLKCSVGKRIGYVLLAVALAVGTERFCHSHTKGFAVSRIVSDLHFHSEWEVPALSDEERGAIDSILDQKFSFLGSGGSFYTFISRDRDYVIKFFKMHHLSKRRAGQKKLDFVFQSCKIAYTDLKEETGVVYLHLNKTKKLHKNAVIADNIGIEHVLDLDSMEFIVQKRADMASNTIAEFMKQGRIGEAQKAVDAIWELMQSITLKGIDDHDMNIATNFGFIDGKAVQIDVGPFKKDARMKEALYYKKRLEKPAKKCALWLKENHPELSGHFEKLIR